MTKPTIEQMRLALQTRKSVPHLARGGNDFGMDSMAPKARNRTSFNDQPTGNQIMKETGGNWLAGNVERELKPLQRKPRTVGINNHTEQDVAHDVALNNWVDRNLTNYVKKQMATKEDPVRALFEQGVTHIPHRDVGLNRYSAPQRRAEQNQPQLAQTEEGKAWENATDAIMGIRPISGLHKSFHEPWMEKVSPDTKVANLTSADNLGFDHIMDVLREDLAEGRIRPEQLNKISMEQAVRRAHEYNEDKKKKMAETAIKNTEGMPLVKQYETGHKWIELAAPQGEAALSDLGKKIMEKHRAEGTEPSKGVLEASIKQGGEEKLKEALKYEGDTMGHCVGGYCPDVLEGRSRIYSLRDAKGEPHVTIETKPGGGHEYAGEKNKEIIRLAEERGIQKYMAPGNEALWAEAEKNLAKRGINAPQYIQQIKGKGNAKPAAKYIPMVQDFVKSGKWTDVGDIQNTGMRATKDVFNENELKKLREAGVQDIPHAMTGEDIQYHHNLITPQGKRLKYDSQGHIVGHEGEFAKGGTIGMATGGSTTDIDAMRLATMMPHQKRGGTIKDHITITERPL